MDDALTIVPFASTTVAATTLSNVIPHCRLVKPYLPATLGSDSIQARTELYSPSEGCMTTNPNKGAQPMRNSASCLVKKSSGDVP